ncbi:MAG: hypothetical protein MJ225_02715 [Bacilli bacterium]|nr:hypothetical protein [Bacilli bacterium]
MASLDILIKDENNKDLIINNSNEIVDSKNPFLVDIKGNRDISTYKIFLNGNKFPSDNILIFSVKVSGLGKIVALMDKNKFNRDEIYKKISPLKDVEVNNSEVALSKLVKAIRFVEEEKPLMTFYFPIDDYYFNHDDLYESLGETNLLFVDKISKPKKIKEKPIKEKPVKEEVEKERSESKLFKKPSWLTKENLAAPFILYWKNALHFLFVLISGFLVFFALSIAMYNSYAGKAIYIFFYICCLAGTGLSGAIFSTIFKRHSIKSLWYFESLFVSIVGACIGIGGFVLYFNSLNNLPYYIPSSGKIILISILISLALIVISSIIPLLIKKYKENKLK